MIIVSSDMAAVGFTSPAASSRGCCSGQWERACLSNIWGHQGGMLHSVPGYANRGPYLWHLPHLCGPGPADQVALPKTPCSGKCQAWLMMYVHAGTLRLVLDHSGQCISHNHVVFYVALFLFFFIFTMWHVQ